MFGRCIVEALPEGHPLLGTVEILLEATGGVYGEFGLVAAYQKKKAAVENWLTDVRLQSKPLRGNICTAWINGLLTSSDDRKPSLSRESWSSKIPAASILEGSQGPHDRRSRVQ